MYWAPLSQISEVDGSGRSFRGFFDAATEVPLPHSLRAGSLREGFGLSTKPYLLVLDDQPRQMGAFCSCIVTLTTLKPVKSELHAGCPRLLVPSGK